MAPDSVVLVPARRGVVAGPGPGRGRGRVAALALLVAGALSAFPAVATAAPSEAGGRRVAATARTAPVAASPSTGGTAGTGEAQPSDAEVRAAREAAEAAHARVEQQSGALDRARSRLATAATAASLSLERYRGAVVTLQQAQLAANAAADALDQADVDLRTAQEALGRWVRRAYGDGGPLTRSPAATTLLSGADLDSVDLARVVLDRNGTATRRALDEVVRSQAARESAADAADQAQRAASDAAVTAATARRSADTAVKDQQAAVDQLELDLSGARSDAADADRRAARLAQARATADARARAWGNQVTGPVGSCRGGDVSRYANGTIPVEDLCPLWGAPGEYLRADAAYAFGRLAQAYAASFGEPLCVTDSYRSYAEQVQVYAAKPALAAVPGRSNHGWGTAADLCGGIESFGTTTHQWMLLNAPGYGWFHPAWAEPAGSRPEAWHWEFAG